MWVVSYHLAQRNYKGNFTWLYIIVWYNLNFLFKGDLGLCCYGAVKKWQMLLEWDNTNILSEVWVFCLNQICSTYLRLWLTFSKDKINVLSCVAKTFSTWMQIITCPLSWLNYTKYKFWFIFNLHIQNIKWEGTWQLHVEVNKIESRIKTA